MQRFACVYSWAALLVAVAVVALQLAEWVPFTLIVSSSALAIAELVYWRDR